MGESIAVDGCCLTVIREDSHSFAFNLSEETRARTRAEHYCEGVSVNLERAMKIGDRFGGHIVQGHVDCVSRLHSIDEIHDSWTLQFSYATRYARYLIDKGSIAVNGISLTLIEPHDDRFSVAVIPHTWMNTTLKSLNPGDRVNLEFDVLAKHVEKLLATTG